MYEKLTGPRQKRDEIQKDIETTYTYLLLLRVSQAGQAASRVMLMYGSQHRSAWVRVQKRATSYGLSSVA